MKTSPAKTVVKVYYKLKFKSLYGTEDGLFGD